MVLHKEYMLDRESRFFGKPFSETFTFSQIEQHKTSFFSDKIKIKEMNGKELPAEEVFSQSIKALISSFKETYLRRVPNMVLLDTDIKWVLTVPAMWSERAKKFMRQCAELAGIPSTCLSIALEPECASVYCQYLTSQYWTEKDDNFSMLSAGRKYMVVDLGGGTVDIAVHEILDGRQLKEIYRTTGSDCGGTSIDSAFLEFLQNIFDKKDQSVIGLVQKENPDEYIGLLRNFELKKRSRKPNDDKIVRMAFPVATFTPFCEKVHNKSPHQVLKASRHGNKVSIKGDKIIICPEIFDGFFTSTIEKILTILESILNKEEMSDITDILLVGGFAECHIVQDKIKSAFKSRRVSVPLDSGLAVLKGAVLYGHRPSSIAVRLIRYTYGVEVIAAFNPKFHSQKYMTKIGGKEYCQHVFSTLIERNTEVEEGKIVTKQYRTFVPWQKAFTLKIYMSTNQNPDYIDNLSCCLLGQLIIHISDPTETERLVGVNYLVGGTELTVTATDCKTGERYSTSLEMVGE